MQASRLSIVTQSILMALPLIACITLTSAAWAQPTKWFWSEERAAQTHIERVEELLQQPATVQPSNYSLMSFLDSCGVPFVIDDKALEDEGVSPDTPVSISTISQLDISMREMLVLVLDPLDLTYVLEGNYILITNKKNSANRTCVYDVGRLIRHSPVGQQNLNQPKINGPNFTEIMRTLESTVTPDVWANGGGTATMMPYRGNGKLQLVISAPTETHFAIQNLFRTLDRSEGIEHPSKSKKSTNTSKANSRIKNKGSDSFHKRR